MSGKSIATIYFYVISAGALALIVIGIFNGVNFFINSTQYDKYPLRYGPGGDCEAGFDYPRPYKVMPAPGSPVESTPSAEEIEKQKQLCIKQQELDRKQHKIEDIRNTLAFTIIGTLLFSIHFPLARKQSSS